MNYNNNFKKKHRSHIGQQANRRITSGTVRCRHIGTMGRMWICNFSAGSHSRTHRMYGTEWCRHDLADYGCAECAQLFTWLFVSSKISHIYFEGSFTMNTDHMSFMERVTNVINYGIVAYYYHRYLLAPRLTNLFRSRFGSDFVDIDEMMSRSSFAFINSEQLIEYARPISHRIVYVNGVGVAEVEPLNGVCLFIMF